jgi:hypothetical protein
MTKEFEVKKSFNWKVVEMIMANGVSRRPWFLCSGVEETIFEAG